MLSVDGVTVSYGEVVALDDLSLVVDEGATVALVGPSGCGKSTLLRVIAGLVSPDDGDVAWRGESLATVPPERRDVGFLFQDHALFTDRSVAENIAFGLRMRGVSKSTQAQRVNELLELVGLGGFGSRRVDQLSGGEAQRVAMARALAPEPRLLLLDEPLAALDRARRDELLDELGRVLDELGQSAIYVTHDHHEAFAIADRLGVMRAGQIERIDTCAQVWRDPRTAFVAEFIGHRVATFEGRRVAIPVDAVTITTVGRHGLAGSAGGDYVGQVTRCRFVGDRHLIEVRVAGPAPATEGGSGDSRPWRAWSRDPLPLGAEVTVTIDRARIADLY